MFEGFITPGEVPAEGAAAPRAADGLGHPAIFPSQSGQTTEARNPQERHSLAMTQASSVWIGQVRK
jgi:hypothetical protein